jgi:hypothetical protein
MLKEILKHTSQYLENDIKYWIFQKALQGSKNDYWDILSTTTNLFYYLFRTEEKINYKKIRKRFLKNPLYIKSSEADKTINDFLHIHENRRDNAYKEY